MWQLSLMTHYQVQLSDKRCVNSMRVSPSQPASPGNFSPAHSDAIYTCAMKGESSSAICLLFMVHQVECCPSSPLFQLLLFFFPLSYLSHMDAARMESYNEKLIYSGFFVLCSFFYPTCRSQSKWKRHQLEDSSRNRKQNISTDGSVPVRQVTKY